MTGPHQDQPVETAGSSLDTASAAVIMTHGRGATARGMIQLANEFDQDTVAYLAPQANRRTWYPNSFLAPVESNEPGRSSGLAVLQRLVDETASEGIPSARVMLLGFSQGACLASEFVARNPTRYGGVAVLSGGLIGDEIQIEAYSGDLAGTPVFLGCSDSDPHIPESRVHETADVFDRLSAQVTTRIYEGMGHGINEDEVAHVNQMIESLTDTP